MATPSYWARSSSETSRASPASSFVSANAVAWNPSERSFSWSAAAISGCLPNPKMRQPVGREEGAVGMPELSHEAPWFTRALVQLRESHQQHERDHGQDDPGQLGVVQ